MSVQSLVFQYSRYIGQCCRKGIQSIQIQWADVVLSVEKDGILPVCAYMKYHGLMQYKTLVDIVVIDYPLRAHRFDVVYVLRSVLRNTRIVLRSQVAALSSVMSITGYYAAAG